MMNELDFMQLGAEAGRALNMVRPEALASGDLVEVDGVPLTLRLDDENGLDAVLVLRLGNVRDEHKIEVYEAVLAMQGALHSGHHGVFDYDGMDDVLCFRQVLPLSLVTTGANLASVIRLYVAQVHVWQQTLLAGRLVAQTGRTVPTGASASGTTSMSLA